MIYLDWNATTPPHPNVLEAMADARDRAWANPSSVHRMGQGARALLDLAREAVAALVGLDPRDVVLTSGGTEANNLAMWHPFADTVAGKGLVLSRLEHPSVVQVAEAHAARGADVRWAAVESDGRVSVADYLREMDALADRLALVVVQAVNHETGVVQPLREIVEHAHRHNALVHVDAVQAVGKLPRTSWEGADSVSVAAHKIRGPKGIGALVTRRGVVLRPLLRGGAQERGIRPGTQDGALAAGFAVAADLARVADLAYRSVEPERDRFERRLVELGQRHGVGVEVNGTATRACHVSNTSWPGWRGPELCAALDLEGVAMSSGAACSAGSVEPSAVVRAMLGQARAESAVRVSMGPATSAAELQDALQCFDRVLKRGPGRQIERS